MMNIVLLQQQYISRFLFLQSLISLPFSSVFYWEAGKIGRSVKVGDGGLDGSGVTVS